MVYIDFVFWDNQSLWRNQKVTYYMLLTIRLRQWIQIMN